MISYSLNKGKKYSFKKKKKNDRWDKEKQNGDFRTEDSETKIKNSVDGINSRMQITEERISEQGDRVIESTQSKHQRQQNKTKWK